MLVTFNLFLAVHGRLPYILTINPELLMTRNYLVEIQTRKRGKPGNCQIGKPVL